MSDLLIDGIKANKFEKLMWPESDPKKPNTDKIKEAALVIFERIKQFFTSFQFETDRSLLMHVLKYLQEQKKQASVFVEPPEVTKIYNRLFPEVFENDPLAKQLIDMKYIDVLRNASAGPSVSVNISLAGVKASVNLGN